MYSIIAAILSIPTSFAAISGGVDTIPTTQNAPVSSVSFEGPFKNENVETVLKRLAGYAVTIGASVATLMILYGAFQILTSRGNIEQVKTGRKTIIYALGGLVVIILAQGLVDLFASITHSLGI